MKPRDRDALDARRLHNYLRLMETTNLPFKDIKEQADKAAQEGKLIK